MHSLGPLGDLHLARVIDSVDPEQRGRLQVELLANGMQLWAACVVNGAGNGYGVSLLPKNDEIVVLGFVSPELPLILGSVWAGNASQPEHGREVEDKYSITSPRGTRVEIDDASGPQITIATESGHQLVITEESGGEITLEKGAETIRLHSGGIAIETGANVEVQAAQVKVSAAMVQVDAGMSKFSGVVQCDTLIATSVVGTSYTPGAGNIW